MGVWGYGSMGVWEYGGMGVYFQEQVFRELAVNRSPFLTFLHYRRGRNVTVKVPSPALSLPLSF
jgi:hypothetical protein